MTKLFKDVDYFITEASNSTQTEFEWDFADIIEVFDTNETTITTECGRTTVITWEDNYFKSYQVIYETPQMESTFKRDVVMDIIKKLRTIEVDGETMQYILEKVGMEDQMLRQLVMSQPIGEVEHMFEERQQLEEFNKKVASQR
jgi:hypothetical protein